MVAHRVGFSPYSVAFVPRLMASVGLDAGESDGAIGVIVGQLTVPRRASL